MKLVNAAKIGILSLPLLLNGCTAEAHKPQEEAQQAQENKQEFSSAEYESLKAALDKEIGVEKSSQSYEKSGHIIFIPDYNHFDPAVAAGYLKRVIDICKRNKIELAGIGLEGIISGKEAEGIDSFMNMPFAGGTLKNEKVAAAIQSGVPIYGIEGEESYGRGMELKKKVFPSQSLKYLNEAIEDGEITESEEARLNKMKEEEKAAQEELFGENLLKRSDDWVYNSRANGIVIVVGGAKHAESLQKAAEKYGRSMITMKVSKEDQKFFGN